MFCVFSVFCGNSLPVCFVGNVVVFSHGIHGIHGMLGCVIGSVGMAGMPYPPNLCASVSISGRLSLPECSVCSACSVGHSLPVCLFGSVVVFSHGIHGIHGMLGCVIGGVGMAGCHTLLICAYPCLSVGGFLCQKVLCVLRILWELSLCLLCWCCRGSCTSVVVFSHGFHGFPRNVRLRYWRRGYGRDAIPS